MYLVTFLWEESVVNLAESQRSVLNWFRNVTDIVFRCLYVQFNLRNFDMALIFKDYTRPVQSIKAIPMNHMDKIQEYLEWALLVIRVNIIA